MKEGASSGHVYLTWDNFSSTHVVREQKRAYRISQQPLVEVDFDGERGCLEMLVELGSDPEEPEMPEPLAAMASSTIERDNKHLLRLSVSSAELFRPFYQFVTAVADRILGDGDAAADAVKNELEVFRELLRRAQGLSVEKQIGLVGELAFLCRLVAHAGPSMVESWIGPLGEPHDFRIDQREFEIKTAVSSRRIHTIHGPNQLQPSSGCTLHLVSLLLGPPGKGSGFSLNDKVHELRAYLSSHDCHANAFEAALQNAGYSDTDAALYCREFAMRKEWGYVEVSDGFPAITGAMLDEGLGANASRVESLSYDLNLEGLITDEAQDSLMMLVWQEVDEQE